MTWRIAIYSLTIAALALTVSPAAASELRTYEFVPNDERPYMLFTEGGYFAAKLRGQFDLLLDHQLNTARFTRIGVHLVEAVILGTTIPFPELNGLSLTQSHGWPNDWTQLTGKIMSPGIVDVTGPGPVLFATNSAGRPMIDFDPNDFIEHLPNGSVRMLGDYQTVLRIQLVGNTARIDGRSAHLSGADYSEPIIFGALAIRIPEPSSTILCIIGYVFAVILSGRRFIGRHVACRNASQVFESLST